MGWTIHVKRHSGYALLLFAAISFATTGIAQSNAKVAAYEGAWYNRKVKRQLIIHYDETYNRYTINDHTKGYSEDVYYAYLKDGKLTTPAENEHHHAPFCEISIIDRQLVLECNSGLNFTDNFINRKDSVDKVVFGRRKE